MYALGFEQNAVHFGIKHQPILCQIYFIYECLPDQFSVIFFCRIYVWDREPENYILVAVLIHNLISVCCSIAGLLGSSVVECAGIRLYWLKFYSHQIRLATESPEQAGLAVMWPTPCWAPAGSWNKVVCFWDVLKYLTAWVVDYGCKEDGFIFLIFELARMG